MASTTVSNAGGVTRAAGASAADDPAAAAEPRERWAQLALISVGIFCAMSPSFASSSVAPLLRQEWGMDALGVSWLLVAMLVGFSVSAMIIGSANPGPPASSSSSSSLRSGEAITK